MQKLKIFGLKNPRSLTLKDPKRYGYLNQLEFYVVGVDPHFSRAPPLDRRYSLFLFICEKLIFGKKSWSRQLFYFYFKGKIKQERKNPKKLLHNFWKKGMSLKNPSLDPGIRLPIGKVPLKGSTPLSPIKVSTN